jgi:hypothetical protein
VRQEVHDYLDERRLLTCELVLESPAYTRVRVAARLRARPEADPARVAQAAAAALYHYLHPTVGGPEGDGWPFGQELYQAEVYSLLQRVNDVQSVDDVSLHVVDPDTGAIDDATTAISLPENGLLCSAEHAITIEAGRTARRTGNGRRR